MVQSLIITTGKRICSICCQSFINYTSFNAERQVVLHLTRCSTVYTALVPLLFFLRLWIVSRLELALLYRFHNSLLIHCCVSMDALKRGINAMSDAWMGLWLLVSRNILFYLRLITILSLGQGYLVNEYTQFVSK